MRELMKKKQDLINFSRSEESKKNMLRAINQIVNLDRDRVTHSDSDYLIYRKTSGVTTFET